jgi:hypothetical protein
MLKKHNHVFFFLYNAKTNIMSFFLIFLRELAILKLKEHIKIILVFFRHFNPSCHQTRHKGIRKWTITNTAHGTNKHSSCNKHVLPI